MKRLALALTLTGVVAGAHAWEEDWALDTQMDVLEQPVRRPIILPYGDGRQRGAPALPLYKQQPAAAQEDFRKQPPVQPPIKPPIKPPSGNP